MPRMIFVNLPVTDLERSVRFYEAIGGRKEPKFSNEQAAMVQFSDAIAVMLLRHEFYSTFTGKGIADAHQTSAALLCISYDSPAEVDAMVDAAASAGGRADPGPKQDISGMCTAAASRIPTATIGSRCGWTRRPPSRAPAPSKPPTPPPTATEEAPHAG